MRLDGYRARQSLVGLSAHCANSYIPQHIYKCSYKKDTEVDAHRSTDLVYVHIRLVTRSHFADLKMTDPVNVWDLPINFFIALKV